MTTLWFYVVALSFEHADAGLAMEGCGFDGAGRYKEDAPAEVSFRSDVLLVGSVEGCTICSGQTYGPIAAQAQTRGLRLRFREPQMLTFSCSSI